MGGYGGGPAGGSRKTQVEESWVLSADRLTSQQMILAGCQKAGVIAWTNSHTGEQLASVGYDWSDLDAPPTLRLNYVITRFGQEPCKINYSIRMESLPTPWGARRWFFRCPVLGCSRRVGKLYLPSGGDYYGCRHCYDLSYDSRQSSRKSDKFYAMLARDTGYDFRTVKQLFQERPRRRRS